MSVISPAPELTAKVKVRAKVRVRVRVKVIVSVNNNNSSAGELADKSQKSFHYRIALSLPLPRKVDNLPVKICR